MSDYIKSKHWYVLYTRSRCEFTVEEALSSAGLEVFLPVTKTIKQWSDRSKEVTTPLFTGYIFIHATEKERLYALENEQVVRCLADAGRPAAVPAWQIENLKTMMGKSPTVQVTEGMAAGEEIEISSGILRGVRGVLLESGGKKQLAISIKLLNRTVIAHLADELVTGSAGE